MGGPQINLGIVIQARMGSSRLPGKVLRPIDGTPLLGYIVRRLGRLRHAAQVVIATSTMAKDDVLADFCLRGGMACFRGSETDVLDRYYQCSRDNAFAQVVRLTADNPFTDVEELDRLIDLHLSTGSDFSHSIESLPVGVGSEVFTFDALRFSHKEGQEPHHREHVDEYLLEHPERFKTSTLVVSGPKNRPDIRLTVDTEDDYRKACFIARHAGPGYISTEEAVRACLAYA